MDTITKYDVAVAGLDRREFARLMRMKYNTISSKMAGFAPWKGDELERARGVLSKAAGKLIQHGKGGRGTSVGSER